MENSLHIMCDARVHASELLTIEKLVETRELDLDRILSIEWLKKSLRNARSVLGNSAIIASRAVLRDNYGLCVHKADEVHSLFGRFLRAEIPS